ncbi:ATP-binding protein [Nonomuraea sediminis]|uniref:ATP-binding protein n=1 Tax=Nonomuraea sediminis TaxID=2835864 RepID=UPI001BDCCFDB|nr:helix-turn-helix transcriptional regulator [Nonomuraea sediminis]
MLLGRAREQGVLEELLAGAAKGVSGACVLLGDPGIGKTALLDHAARAAGDARVIRGIGVEAEAELPFAAVHLLLGSELDRLDRLPAPQAAALRGALGLAAAGPGDRFLVGLALLSLLADLAEDGPLVCLIDDAHWLDHASAEALLFAARRLDAEGVALVLASRPGFDPQGLPVLRLAGLTKEAAAELLDVRDPGLRRRILDEARGNPLALIELPKSLAGGPDVPLTDRLRAAFEQQADGLSAGGRAFLQVAAAESTGELGVLLAVAEPFGATLADVEAAQEIGLVRVAGRRVEFRHPLVRAAVSQGTPLGRRLAVHEALARVVDGERRVWHLAAAAIRPDERLAGELERTAASASARAGYASAAAAYERAAELSVDAAARARRLTLAAEALEFGGRFDRARDVAAGTREADAELTSRLIRVRACSDYGQGSLPDAHALLTLGIDHIAATDPRNAAWLLLDATSLVWFNGDREMARRTARRLDALRLPADDEAVPVLQLCRWFAGLALRTPVDALPPLPEVVTAARALAGPDRRGLLLIGGLGLAEHDAATHELAARTTVTLRAEGRVGVLPQALTYLAAVQLSLGRPADAHAHATEAARIAADTHQPEWERQAGALLARIAAIRGEEVDPADTEARALLDLGQGRAESALLGLESLVYGRASSIPAMRCVPYLVEAAVRGGRAARAAEPFARFASWADLLGQRWALALASRCRALLDEGPTAEDHFTAALVTHDRPLDRAHTALLYGEWLRRARRKSDARTRLVSALEDFERLGATPWAERARAELDATGWTAPRNTGVDRFARLTPQERQIVQLAAQGLTNRDIAAHLFLSPRTVGQHLYKAYPKLGVTSRTQLTELSLNS